MRKVRSGDVLWVKKLEKKNDRLRTTTTTTSTTATGVTSGPLVGGIEVLQSSSLPDATPTPHPVGAEVVPPSGLVSGSGVVHSPLEGESDWGFPVCRKSFDFVSNSGKFTYSKIKLESEHKESVEIDSAPMAPYENGVQDSSPVPVFVISESQRSPSSDSDFGESVSSNGRGASPSILVAFPSVTRSDDELTSLSWLQDANLLIRTALSPMKQNQRVLQETETEDSNENFQDESDTPTKSNAKEKRSRSQGNSQGPKGHLGPEVSPDEGPETPLGQNGVDLPHDQGCHQNGVVDASSDRSAKETSSVPYNPKVHIKAKPPFSFSCLIFMAIEASNSKALPVKDIYAWIIDHYPYYRTAPTGWKNSVRHNLSLNKCFSKIEKSPNLGKGSLWMVDPAFRPNLVQAMSKTPLASLTPQYLHPVGEGGDNGILPTVFGTKYIFGLTSKSADKEPKFTDFVVKNETEILPSGHPVSDSSYRKMKPDILSGREPNSENIQHLTGDLLRVGGIPHRSEAQIVICPADGRSQCVGYSTSNTELSVAKGIRISGSPMTNGIRLPERLPSNGNRLSGLAVVGDSDRSRSCIDSSFRGPVRSEDVDAAAAMLALKHGRQVFLCSSFGADNPEETHDREGGSNQNGTGRRLHQNVFPSTECSERVANRFVCSDHTYPDKEPQSLGRPRPFLRSPRRLLSATTFNDGDSEASNLVETVPSDLLRHVAHRGVVLSPSVIGYEKTDALLNLAAVATSLASHEDLQEVSNRALFTTVRPGRAKSTDTDDCETLNASSDMREPWPQSSSDINSNPILVNGTKAHKHVRDSNGHPSTEIDSNNMKNVRESTRKLLKRKWSSSFGFQPAKIPANCRINSRQNNLNSNDAKLRLSESNNKVHNPKNQNNNNERVIDRNNRTKYRKLIRNLHRKSKR